MMDEQEIIRERKRLYMQIYRRKNKEKIKEINNNYWLRQGHGLEVRSIEALEKELEQLRCKV